MNDWHNWPLLCSARGDGIWWVRLYGFGVSIKDESKWPPLFSERYGYVTYFRAFGWGIKLFGPPKIALYGYR